jgi:glycine betaine/proline transport system ATP-binding protein
VKDVNRAKVIKAKIIMIPTNKFKGSKNSNTIKVKEDTFLDEFLPKVCLTPATVEVVDKSGNVKGYITDKELSNALTKSHSNGVYKPSK